MKLDLSKQKRQTVKNTEQNVFKNEHPEWDLTLTKCQKLKPKLEKIMQLAHNRNWDVVHIATVEWSEKNLPANINRLYQTNPEAAFYSTGKDRLLLNTGQDKVFHKNSYSAFGGTQGKLHRWLKQQRIDDLVICGIYSTGCVFHS